MFYDDIARFGMRFGVRFGVRFGAFWMRFELLFESRAVFRFESAFCAFWGSPSLLIHAFWLSVLAPVLEPAFSVPRSGPTKKYMCASIYI